MARQCKSLNREGKPCRAAPLEGSDYCRAHDPNVPDEVRFGSKLQAARAGSAPKPRTPSVMEELRRRVEEEAETVLAPHFEALDPSQDIELRMRASAQLLDRAYGRPASALDLLSRERDDEHTLDESILQVVARMDADADASDAKWGKA